MEKGFGKAQACGCICLDHINPSPPTTAWSDKHLTVHLHLDTMCKKHRKQAEKVGKTMVKSFKDLKDLGYTISIK